MNPNSLAQELRTAPDVASRTKILQTAIDHAADSEGFLAIPKGRWEVAMLTLRDGLHLHLPAGATLVCSDDLSQYPRLERGHNKDRQGYHFLHAEGVSDLQLTGPGVLEGQGEKFWTPPTGTPPWWRAKESRVTPMIEIKNVTNLRIRDLVIRNSPGWTVHLFNCDGAVLDGVVVENHMFGPNTDGFDINGCRNVHVCNCRIHACDDAIIIKSTQDARSCEHITITNCILESNCAAIGIGAECWNDIRYVAASNCTILNAIRMIQIIIWDGGTVENCVFSNITGRALTPIGTDRVIHFDVQQHQGERDHLGHIRNITVSNLNAETRGRVLLTAQDGATIDNVTLRDIRLTYPEVEDPGITVAQSGSNQLSNFSPDARFSRAAVVADNVRGLHLSNLTTHWPDASEQAAPHDGLWLRNVTDLTQEGPQPIASAAGAQEKRIHE